MICISCVFFQPDIVKAVSEERNSHVDGKGQEVRQRLHQHRDFTSLLPGFGGVSVVSKHLNSILLS